MNISWIRFKTSWDTGKTDRIGVFDTGNNSRIRHHKSIVLEIVDFSVVLYTIC